MENIYYTGIGSRKTPPSVLKAFEFLGEEFAKRGYWLRSGGADGADSAFEKGCKLFSGKSEIYLPWQGFNGKGSKKSEIYEYYNIEEATSLAKKYHPCWDNLSFGGKALMTRNSYQILGLDLQTPSSFVVCYTKDGKGGGGTGQALRIAKDYGIKICDFGRFPKEQAMDAAKQVLSAIDKELFIQKESDGEKQSNEKEIIEHE